VHGGGSEGVVLIRIVHIIIMTDVWGLANLTASVHPILSPGLLGRASHRRGRGVDWWNGASDGTRKIRLGFGNRRGSRRTMTVRLRG